MTDGTWRHGAGSDFNTASNWINLAPPVVPTNLAIFTASATKTISFSANTFLNMWLFNEAAEDYIFTIGSGRTVQLQGYGILIQGGSVTINNSGTFNFVGVSTAGSATINNNTNGGLQFFGASSAGSATITNNWVLTFNNNSTAGDAAITNNGRISVSNNSTAGDATIASNGDLYFDGASTAGGATITNGAGKRLEFYDTSTAGDARLINGGGRVDFSLSAGPNGDGKLRAGSIEGSGAFRLGDNELTVGSNNRSTIVTGTIQDGGDALGVGASLVKVGTGTLTLAGANTYTGGTTVNGGTLLVNGTILNAATVNSGGTLGGKGTVDGPVTVNAGGRLAPGPTAGRLSSDGVTFEFGSRFMVDVGGSTAPGSGHDQLAVTGTVKITGATLQAAKLGAGPSNNAPQRFVIIDNDGIDPVQGTFGGLPEGAGLLAGGRFFTISYKGGTGNDVVLTSGGAKIVGTSRNDVIDGKKAPAGQPVATQMADDILGNGGNDTLYGLGGNDRLYGGAGKDTLIGGAGADKLYGGAGIDTASYASASKGVTASLAKSSANKGDAAGDTYSSIENLTGSRFGDTLTGNGGSNVIKGEGGADRLRGGAGNDQLYGGVGADRLYGDAGGDRLYGGAGGDQLYGGGDNDRAYGGAGNDEAYGGAGVDRLYGDAGNDRLYGGTGADKLYGGSGNDHLYGGAAGDELYGGAGNDRFYGGAGNDLIFGGGGTDRAFFSGPAAGYDIRRSGDTVIVRGPEGIDRLVGVEFAVFPDGAVAL